MEEVISSVGSHEIHTSGYQVFHLEDIEFHWEDLDMNMDAFLQTSKETHFFPSTLDNYEMGSLAQNPVLTEKEEDWKNCPPHPSRPVCQQPKESPRLLRTHSFGPRIETVPIFVSEKLFE